MATFRYSGRTPQGEAVAGTSESESAAALADHLLARGITPVEIRAAAGARGAPADLARLLRRRPTTADLILFCRQMYAVTKAGLPLLSGVRTLAASTPNAALKSALEAVLQSLQTGRDLASSLARHPDVFSHFFVSVVRVGESSGTLETAFRRLYEHLGKQKRLDDRVRAALRYPATVVAAIGIAVTIITLWVLPRFEPIFAALGDNLPWATKVLLGVSSFAASYWFALLAAAAVAVLAFRAWVRTERGLHLWDGLKLRVPVLGALVQKATLARVCGSLALTFEAGVPIIQGVGMVARAAGNEHMSRRLVGLKDGIERGESLSRAAQNVGLFTPLALQMMSIGEETGALAEMLAEVADFYEREVDHDLESLSAAIEPMLIVAVGVMVLILALGVFLPLWDMAAQGGGFG